MNRGDALDVLRGMAVEPLPFRLHRPAGSVPSAPAVLPTDPDPELRGYEEGFARGRADGVRGGYEEGVRQGRAEVIAGTQAAIEEAVAGATRALEERAERLSQLIAAVEAAAAERLQACDDEMLALSYETVCKVLGSEALLPSTVRTHLTQVLARNGRHAVLHVHPDDAALMQESCAPAGGALHWVPDPAVTLGGCIVVRTGGGVDQRMETALERCKEVLLAARTARACAPEEKP